MNMREPDQSPPQANAIGDHNVERLLTNAYQPEMLDPEFVEQVYSRAFTAAKEVRREANASPAAIHRNLRRETRSALTL